MKLIFLTFCFLLSAQAGDIAEELTNAGATTLLEFVTKAGLAETLAGEGPFTVFAPSNEAFDQLPEDIVATLMEDTELLKKVLLYHVVSGSVMSKDITNDQTVASVEGTNLRANIYLKSDYYDGFVTVNGARVKTADIEASNGVIHMVTNVIYPLIPQETIADLISTDPRFSTLQAAITAAEASEVLSGEGPVTIFAPTNEAFDKVPSATLTSLLGDKEALTKVLLRHVVPGTVFRKGIYWNSHVTAGTEGDGDDKIATQVFKNNIAKVVSYSGGNRAGARVVDYDILASNGVIHAIDNVI